ncbi:uncharacterized protein DUF1269 [Paraburkholderia eburnea]|uniref:Uncharacterized protein DUF1269 n=1 Tax=Paraburkholderia eburnea TaxID=1189126 RepID=A0A2S4LWA8_9BURK|nr:DUF1269 domain-containing protein [Paraburkholderia eburnea]POR46717.1 uncharacterized protein DUF1269 [Paraburkholderia eburnea]PRZ17906.1 uncharacterized protein DUF1269 [Paraburkholderia eburnea]
MSQELIVATFGTLDEAQRAARDFKNFETDGQGLKIESGVMVQKDPSGMLKVLDEYSRPHWGTVIGAATGALIGLLGGPLGAIAGLTIGAGVGLGTREIEAHLDSKLTKTIEGELKAGCWALVLETHDPAPAQIDEIVHGYGGQVFRQALAW